MNKTVDIVNVIRATMFGPTGDECASQEYRLKLYGREITSGGPETIEPESA